MQEKAETGKIIMYGSPACPGVPAMKSLLNQSHVDYEYINIFQDIAARQRLREINNGYDSVPTFVFPDGSTLTEPQAGELKKKLQELGYTVPLTAMITGNIWLIFTIAMLIFALLRVFGVF